jgi:hypothetical protein
VQRGSRIALLCAASIGSVAFTLWVLLVFLAPAESAELVTFEQLTLDVAAGRVDEIRIDGRSYAYRLRDGATTKRKRAAGPEPDLAHVRALRPAASNTLRPTIRFEP